MSPSSSSSKPKDRDRDRGANRKAPKDDDSSLSLNLWIGSLSSDTTDHDLIKIFAEYGAMDALTSYTPRTYAFVFFRTAEDAKKAKEALQGKVVKGVPIKIEFARTAKPGKSLWIGGISSSVTQEELEDELSNYGKLEEYKFLRARNSALVSFLKLDDAIAAHKNLNGKSLGGEQIRVDFQKPQYSRSDLPDHHNSKDRRSVGPLEPWLSPDDLSYHTSLNQGLKRQQPHGGRRDAPPSNTLWVGYPASVHVTELMLHNSMILFGEIEKIKCFPSRNYSFVQFRSIDEARRAKEGLQGRLFGDSRIQILFSNSEIGSGYRGPTPDMLFNEPPFAPVEYFGPNQPMGQNSYPRQFLPKKADPSMSMRPFSTQRFEHRQVDRDFDDFGGPIPNFPGSDPNGPTWKHPSPFTGSSSSAHAFIRPVHGEWDDGYDMRELKRSRGEGMGDMFGLPQSERLVSGQSHSPVVRGLSRLRGSPDLDHCWRGVIAKGGNQVCHARCVPIDKGLESPLPEVVNCFARTDLDMLAKHCGQAIGFDIVFFLPDSEEDFASYTEFLHYLGNKNRVGVAKFDDGTTLFLVPPSDFLKKVLKVSGPERLYGVVLKLPNQPETEVKRPQVSSLPTPSHYVMQEHHQGPPPPHYPQQEHQQGALLHFINQEHQQGALPHYINQEHQQGALPHYINQEHWQRADGYDYVPKFENSTLRTDHSVSHAGVGVPLTGERSSIPLAPHDYARNPEAAPKPEVSLTPELIATLTSFMPSNSRSSTAGSGNITLAGSSTTYFLPANLTSGASLPSQGWVRERQDPFSTNQLEPAGNTQQQLQEFGGQCSIPAPAMTQYPAYAHFPNGPENSIQPGLGITQVQDLASSMQQVSATPTRQLDNHAPSQSNLHYQHSTNFDTHNANGVLQPTDSMKYSAPASSSSQGQAGIVYENQVNPNAGFSAQVQQVQMAGNRSGEDTTSTGDVDKNQRYQSTLQFAASLLQKIQQQQQQSSGQAAGGSGNQP